MKKFSNLKTVLFDSSNASFRMTIEGVFIKKNPTGNYSDLVYVSDQGNGSLNPNIYLTFSNKTEGAKALYTSYPQIPKFRSVMGAIADILEEGTAFDDIDGMLTVKAAYAKPRIISGIGKQSRWVSFKIVAVESGDNGVVTAVPGVSIEISDMNDTSYTSVLTDDEFLTVYHIIKDINLPQIQINMSLAFLAADGSSGNAGAMPMMAPQMNPYQNQRNGGWYSQPQNQGGYYQNNGGFNNQYQQPRQNNYQPQQRFNNTNMGRQITTTQPTAQPVNSPAQTATADTGRSWSQQTTAAPSNNLPPRSEKPIVNLKSVEDTPVSDVDFDDLGAIDDILNGNM